MWLMTRCWPVCTTNERVVACWHDIDVAHHTLLIGPCAPRCTSQHDNSHSASAACSVREAQYCTCKQLFACALICGSNTSHGACTEAHATRHLDRAQLAVPVVLRLVELPPVQLPIFRFHLQAGKILVSSCALGRALCCSMLMWGPRTTAGSVLQATEWMHQWYRACARLLQHTGMSDRCMTRACSGLQSSRPDALCAGTRRQALVCKPGTL